MQGFLKILARPLAHGFDDGAAEVGIHDRGVHVAFSANGGRITKALRDSFNGGAYVFFGLRLRIKFFEFAQGDGREDGAGPGAKIFGGKFTAADFTQIIIHVAGRDVLNFAVRVDVLK